MADREVVVSQDVRTQLGDALAEVLASVWPVDCQTCNRPLIGRATALSVEDMGTFASASLHHKKCRPSQWNTAGAVEFSALPALSHHVLCVLLPIVVGESSEPALQPFVVVNPGLEQVFLDRAEEAGHGRWRVTPGGAFIDAGLRQPPVMMAEPVEGAFAMLRSDSVAVVFDPPLVGPYDVNLTEQAHSLIDEQGGLMLAITHAIDPHAVRFDHDLQPVLSGDRTVLGWVELEERRRSRVHAQEPPPRLGKLLVLQQTGHHVWVGEQIASTLDDLSGEAAKEWADKHLPEGMLGWRPLADDPATGWYTMNAQDVRHRILARHPDGWKLIDVFALHSSVTTEGEHELRAWAAPHVKRKINRTGINWRPGQAPPECVVLYGDV